MQSQRFIWRNITKFCSLTYHKIQKKRQEAQVTEITLMRSQIVFKNKLFRFFDSRPVAAANTPFLLSLSHTSLQKYSPEPDGAKSCSL